MAAADIGASTGPSGERTPWTTAQIATVASCSIINALDGMDVAILSYLAPALSGDLQLSPTQLGALFSAGLAGMAIGGVLIAPLADRVGRRALIMCALAGCTIAMLLSGFVGNLEQLLLLRFIIGTGIGSIVAATTALVSESAPAHHRNLAVAILTCSYPLGSLLTGLAVASSIQAFDWRTIMIGAGVVSALFFPVAFKALPETLPALRQRPDVSARQKAGLRGLFAPGQRASTLLLWAGVSACLMTYYFIVSWVPKLAVLAGHPQRDAVLAGSALNLGAFLGAILVGVVSTRFDLKRTTSLFFLAAIPLMMSLTWMTGTIGLFVLSVLIAGAAVQAGLSGLYSVSARAYPPEARSTGVGWAIGIGRGGAVIGPALGGVLMTQGMPPANLFAIFALPMLVCAATAIFVTLRD